MSVGGPILELFQADSDLVLLCYLPASLCSFSSLFFVPFVLFPPLFIACTVRTSIVAVEHLPRAHHSKSTAQFCPAQSSEASIRADQSSTAPSSGQNVGASLRAAEHRKKKRRHRNLLGRPAYKMKKYNSYSYELLAFLQHHQFASTIVGRRPLCPLYSVFFLVSER